MLEEETAATFRRGYEW